MSAIVALCRIVVVLVFLSAALNKARAFPQFRRTIVQFHLLPSRLGGLPSWCIALMVLLLETLTAVAAIAGGAWLLIGFGLALALLLTFSTALAWLLLRGIQTPCNCFGTSAHAVSSADLWRNAGLLLCVGIGCAALLATGRRPAPLGLAEWLLLGLAAAIISAIWLNLGEIVALVQRTQT
jgi:hypothetical protein